MEQGSELERAFESMLVCYNVTGWVREHRFSVRRFRFDYAWPEKLVAVELDGGTWKPHGGRHGGDADREKLNLAATLGWRVLRFSKDMLRKDPHGCLVMLKHMLETKGPQPG